MLLNFFSLLFIGFVFFACTTKTDGYAPSILDEGTGLNISPSTVTLAVNNQITFTTTGGDGVYTYSIESGSGSILTTTGAFTAPGAPGITLVRVIDGSGQYAEATVTIVAALQITPASASLGVNGTQVFSASGGVAPFTFSKSSGIGTVDASTGLYTAPSSPGVAVIRVTDAIGNVADANVSIFSALGISPSTGYISVNNTLTFTAAGGTGPYTFSIQSGLGSINASSGLFTAAGTAGSVTVRVTDNVGATADAFMTVLAVLQISPVAQVILTNSTIQFSATGGLEPYSFSIALGTGTIDADTGDFTAPASTGFVTVRATDSAGNTSDSTITVTSQIFISPTSITIAVNNNATFTGSGGLPAYSFSMVSGGGSINASTGVYTAPGASGSATVRITDSLGANTDAVITINPALAIAPANPTTTALTGNIFFTASGGVMPYTYSLFSGVGSIDSSTGVYTAPVAAGTAVIRVTDSYGNTTNTNVTIIDGLGINPAGITLSANSLFTFAGLSGQAPYTFSILSGGGSINASTGEYTAPGAAGGAVVRVTDSLMNTADANVTINPVLQISPASITIAVNNTVSFSATGGVSPFTYSVFSGGGSINASTGLYTAPGTSGSVTVRVTDVNGATSDSVVTINNALSLSPATAAITVVDTQSFTGSGGVSPYTYDVISGPGAINSGSGLYTPASAGTITIRVTDSINNTATSTLQVNQTLLINPSAFYLTINSDYQFTTSGGVAPMTFAITAGSGSIDSATGIYTAPSGTGSATVRVTDSMGHTSDSVITLYAPMTLTPLSATIGINQTQAFVAAGGVGTRTFSVFDGDGSIDAATGLYTAPNLGGDEYIRVTDSIGNIVEAIVTVVSTLTISPANLKLPVFSTAIYSAILGTAPYTYSISSGTGSIDSLTGLLTAPAATGSAVVQVQDASLDVDTSVSLTYIKPIEIVSGAYHACVRYDDGSVKCFGDNGSGQLGIGSTSDVGDSALEIGGANLFLDLGTGRTAKGLTSGYYHTCALLDNDQMKCWGQNTYGQLGVGATDHRGNGPNEMGDNLPQINLGTGRTVLKIFAQGYTTCAILDNNSTKCWGRNNYGQVGQGNITSRGTTPSQMGDNLPVVDFGTGRTAVKITGGLDFNCALLDDATVKCWGRNNYGQLGKENVLTLGDGAGEMGNSLTAINLGTGRTVVQLESAYNHTCAVLDDNTTKCWGRNNRGQLGQASTLSRGDGVGEMGDALAVAPLTSFTPVQLFGGLGTACGLNASGAVRCWGYNNSGQLLIGSVSNQGDGAGEIAALANMNFGTGGETVTSFAFGYYRGCAILSNDRIKCFGNALNGALLNGTTATHLGDSGGELGDSLPWVNH